MNNLIKKMVVSCITCSMLLSMTPVVSAEDTVEKNFEYYLTLSDEEVFKEYCATYGYDYDYWVSEGEMPESGYAWMYFEIEYTSDIEITDSTYYEWVENPKILGFPADWYVEEIMTTEYELEDGSWGAEGISAKVCFSNFSNGVYYGNDGGVVSFRVNISDFLGDFDHNNIYNIYRVRMTLENSPFVQTYGNPIRTDDRGETWFAVDYVLTEGDITPPTDPLFGDINADGAVDATDAALLLEYAAAVGAGNATGTLEEYLASKG